MIKVFVGLKYVLLNIYKLVYEIIKILGPDQLVTWQFFYCLSYFEEFT